MPTGQGAGIGCLRYAVGMRTHPGRITCGGISDASCELVALQSWRAVSASSRLWHAAANAAAWSRLELPGTVGGRCVLPGCDRLNLACLRLRCVMRCGAWHGMAWQGGMGHGAGVECVCRIGHASGLGVHLLPSPLPSRLPCLAAWSACQRVCAYGIGASHTLAPTNARGVRGSAGLSWVLVCVVLCVPSPLLCARVHGGGEFRGGYCKVV